MLDTKQTPWSLPPGLPRFDGRPSMDWGTMSGSRPSIPTPPQDLETIRKLVRHHEQVATDLRDAGNAFYDVITEHGRDCLEAIRALEHFQATLAEAKDNKYPLVPPVPAAVWSAWKYRSHTVANAEKSLEKYLEIEADYRAMSPKHADPH